MNAILSMRRTLLVVPVVLLIAGIWQAMTCPPADGSLLAVVADSEALLDVPEMPEVGEPEEAVSTEDDALREAVAQVARRMVKGYFEVVLVAELVDTSGVLKREDLSGEVAGVRLALDLHAGRGLARTSAHALGHELGHEDDGQERLFLVLLRRVKDAPQKPGRMPYGYGLQQVAHVAPVLTASPATVRQAEVTRGA